MRVAARDDQLAGQPVDQDRRERERQADQVEEVAHDHRHADLRSASAPRSRCANSASASARRPLVLVSSTPETESVSCIVAFRSASLLCDRAAHAARIARRRASRDSAKSGSTPTESSVSRQSM